MMDNPLFSLSWKAGDVVQTTFGVGVIVEARQTDWAVRLWRQPGKSIASSAVAYLQRHAILQKLPSAPGMVAKVKQEFKEKVPTPQVLVQTYSTHRKVYLITCMEEKADANSVDKDKSENAEADDSPPAFLRAHGNSSPAQKILHFSSSTLVELPVDALEPSPAAKFYPVLETLMRRGDETAAKARQFWDTQPATQKVVQKTGKALWKRAENDMSTTTATTKVALDQIEPTVQAAKGKIHELASEAEKIAPQVEKQFRQILTMVKDEEIATLLKNAKNRLEQLVSHDLPTTTKNALAKQGISIDLSSSTAETDSIEQNNNNKNADSESSASTMELSLEKSRKVALKSIQKILQQADLDASDLQAVRGELTQNFSTAFDALATAARSDRNLHNLFDTISEKTGVWQETTGRLLQTRSASLFLEGASRLQARAAAIFLVHKRMGSEIGSKFTKAFTEGDAALARIKSIQLGDAIKDRLVRAIEVRSDSLGGLDAIIAGALTSVRQQDADTDKIKNMLTAFQSNASSTTADARETLIAVLSRQNTYRDVALSRLELVLCDLENQFGQELSPEDIAAVARGEGGTAKLFEPIARRAWKQIEKQLDEAESQVSDKNVLQGLSRVRKIMSGELTLSALTDEIVSVLNDENIVAAGEVFVQRGEEVLDVLEGVSSNKVVNDALKIAEKAGITKDSVMREIQKLDVDQLLDTAGGAVTDESKRRQLVSSAIDTALDFILRILPSMPVPPFEGVRDGLLYNISNLSMAGFKVKKEDIMIELAGMRALKRSNSTQSDQSGNSVSDEEKFAESDRDDGSHENAQNRQELVGAADTMEIEEINQEVNAAELLIIDVRRISAVLDNTEWSFEQTYMPYLRGNGKSDVRLSDGAIRLQFELRRRRKAVVGERVNGAQEDEWEPVLCLHDRSCSIDEVELKMQGEGRLTWLVNKAASIFKNALRDYVVRTILKVLTNKSGWLLEKLNGVLAPYWDLILKTAKLKLEDLMEADDEVVVKEVEKEDPSLFELVWRERLPLGMNLLMNDGSGLLKVVDFPRGSQARLVAEKRNLDPDIFKGATIVAVNGTFFEDQEELFDALRDPARPKTVQFRLAESEDAERVRRFVEGDKKEEDEDDAPAEKKFELRSIKSDGEIGIELKPSPDKCGLVVSGFMEGSDAEKSGLVRLGDLLTHVNGVKVISTDGEGQSRSLDALAKSSGIKPLVLSFTEPYLIEEVVNRPNAERGSGAFGGPDELILEEKKEAAGSRRVYIKKFKQMCGMAEGGGILIGDFLAFVNGIAFGVGRRWLGDPRNESLDELYEILYNKDYYPMGITFARPKVTAQARWTTSSTQDFSDMEADTICITIETPDRIGCVFEMHPNGDIAVKDFIAVPGVFNRALTKYADPRGRLDMAIDSVNEQFVPSYATAQMVQNALKRSWNGHERRVALWLCDDEKRDWVASLTGIDIE